MRNLFIASTKKNEGKTLISMALLSEMKKKHNVGYFKPVGHIPPNREDETSDSDISLIKEVSQLESDMSQMGPLTIKGRFPLDWVTKQGREGVVKKINNAFTSLSREYDSLVIEGTGNSAAGAAFGLSNASLAKQMNAKVLLISSGGVGQPIDEILLNKSYFNRAGAEILGVVINKVFPHEMETINNFMKKVLESVDVRLFGVIPYNTMLVMPSLGDVLREFNGEVLCGEGDLKRKVGKIVMGTSSNNVMAREYDGTITLVVSGDREDLIHSALIAAYVTRKAGFVLSGIIITGTTKPSDMILVPLKKVNLPVIWVKENSYTVAANIHHLQGRLTTGDLDRIDYAKSKVGGFIDIQSIMDELQS